MVILSNLNMMHSKKTQKPKKNPQKRVTIKMIKIMKVSLEKSTWLICISPAVHDSLHNVQKNTKYFRWVYERWITSEFSLFEISFCPLSKSLTLCRLGKKEVNRQYYKSGIRFSKHIGELPCHVIKKPDSILGLILHISLLFFKKRKKLKKLWRKTC